MSIKQPDFAEVVKNEMALSSEECDQFLKLEVAWLIILASVEQITHPRGDEYSRGRSKQSYRDCQNKFNEQLQAAPRRILQAMKRYMELQIEWLENNK